MMDGNNFTTECAVHGEKINSASACMTHWLNKLEFIRRFRITCGKILTVIFSSQQTKGEKNVEPSNWEENCDCPKISNDHNVISSESNQTETYLNVLGDQKRFGENPYFLLLTSQFLSTGSYILSVFFQTLGHMTMHFLFLSICVILFYTNT